MPTPSQLREQLQEKVILELLGPAGGPEEIVTERSVRGRYLVAVAAAYGWEDIDLGHDFHETQQGLRYTIAEPARRELLARLLELNHQRHEEEVRAGLHEKTGRGRKSTKKSKTESPEDNGQMRLL